MGKNKRGFKMKYYIRLENEKEHICQEVTKELQDKINNLQEQMKNIQTKGQEWLILIEYVT